MGIEPTPTAWKAVILAVILMMHFVKVQKNFFGFSESQRNSKMLFIGILLSVLIYITSVFRYMIIFAGENIHCGLKSQHDRIFLS